MSSLTSLTSEKLAQAGPIVAAAGGDVWLIFDRETADGGDPVLPLLIEGSLTWPSALILTRTGYRVAIVGSFDAAPIEASGNWDRVIPYVEGVGEPLRETLEQLIPESVAAPRIAVNFSTDDDKADGLSHGMYLLLEENLRGTRFEGALAAAGPIPAALRGRKSPAEIARMKGAIAETVGLFDAIAAFARVGRSEREIFNHVQGIIDGKGLGYSWERTVDPIVNTGPDSMVGHGVASDTITVQPGHILHVDLGVTREEYCSDMQRCWYVAKPGDRKAPPDVERAVAAVAGAISAAAAELKPGVAGWRVDAAARSFLTEAGYPAYDHATGHQVGRRAHDGGGLLGPRWERYGNTPMVPIEKDQVYTLELGVMVEGRGYLGLEEMVVVTAKGCEWLTERQREMGVVGA